MASHTSPPIEEYSDEEILPDGGIVDEKFMSYKRKRTFAILCCTSFFYGLGNSLYGPLLPVQAEKKHLTPMYYGLAIGCYYLMTLLFTPIIGLLLQRISTKWILFCGMLTIGVCSILFGTLEWCPDGIAFTALLFSIRLLDGFGAASVRCPLFAVSVSCFPEKLWTSFINLEICFGIGMVVGPIAGGALYDFGGVGLPFYGSGVLMILASLIALILIPEPDIITMKFMNEFWTNFKQLENILYFFGVFTVSFYSGFLEPVLQPYLQQFAINGLITGLIFQTPNAISSITAYLWKWKIGKGGNNVMLLFLASLILAASVIFIVPAPFTTLKASVGLVVGALVLKGLGQSSKEICTFHGAYTDSVYRGLSNDITTHSYVFQMYILASSAGSCLGSLLSGIVYEKIGFSNGSFLPLGMEVLMIPFVLIYAFKRNYRKPIPFHTPNESRPILS